MAAVDQAIECDTIREKIEAFTENDDIKGVGVTVATAILVFIDPDRFHCDRQAGLAGTS